MLESIISIVCVTSAQFVLSVMFFEPNGERHHGQEGKAPRVDQERREGIEDDGAQQDTGAEDRQSAQEDRRRPPPKGARLGRFAELARLTAPARPRTLPIRGSLILPSRGSEQQG